MSDREPRLLIGDIIDAAEKIKEYTSNLSFENFISDSKTVDAVIRNFEIIGEAARRLPDEFKVSTSQIDWSRIIGFRNRIVHDYIGIDYKIVWRIVQNNIDDLINDLNELLKKI
jgi:uncharacterized protein with HEPN domain